MLSDLDVKNKLTANGITTTFAIPFDVIDEATPQNEVAVYVIDESDPDDPTETLKTLTTHYTIVGSNVVFVSAPGDGSGDIYVMIIRKGTFTQEVDLAVNSEYPAAATETGLDKIVAQIQVLGERIGRALKFRKSMQSSDPDIEVGDPVEDCALIWNEDGTKVIAGPTATAIATAEASAVAAAASAAAASASASGAATSAAAASASATAAANSATAAAASATAAASSATSASASATTATTQATNAAASAATATTQASNAATSASSAATSATNAATSATNASNSATAAAGSATAAAASATAAAASAVAAAASEAAVAAAVATMVTATAAFGTDNRLLRSDGALRLAQASGITVSDADGLSGITILAVDNITVDGNTVSSTNADGNIELEPNGNGLVRSTKRSAFTLAMAIGQNTVANTKSILELVSTTLGFLGPRMTTTQRDAITSVPEGLEIYNTTSHKKNVYNGTSWTDVGGGGGGGSLIWLDDADGLSPLRDTQNNLPVRLYEPAGAQYLYAAIRVPSSYTPGQQINMKLPYFSPDSSGNVLLTTLATLIRTGTDAITSTTNQRTSTNTATTLTNANRLLSHTCDLTDTAGAINSVAVAAGDIILVRLTRGTDTATSNVRAIVEGAEVTFAA